MYVYMIWTMIFIFIYNYLALVDYLRNLLFSVAALYMK